MSADQYDVEQAGHGALAQPAVDILPMAGARKGKQAPEPAAEPVPVAAPYAPSAEAPVEASAAAPVAPAAPVASVEGWQPPPVNPWTGSAEAAAPAAPEPVAVDEQSPAAKKFLGMQLRRPKKDEAAAAAELAVVPTAEAPAAPVWSAPEIPVPAPGTGTGSGPIAAWPTDVSVGVVAGAEPAAEAWGPPAEAPVAELVPVSYAYADTTQDDAHGEAADSAPVEAPVEASVEAPVNAPVDAVPPVVEPEAPAGPPPFPGPVVPAPVDDSELRAVRGQLEASEAARVAAELRADQAVAYAQQVQAELATAREESAAKLAAVETKARTAANDAQDWQIRHREAETQIADLVTSVSGAEQRLAEMRAERDELMAALEEATSPVASTETAGVSADD